jgi:hypothetical protein
VSIAAKFNLCRHVLFAGDLGLVAGAGGVVWCVVLCNGEVRWELLRELDLPSGGGRHAEHSESRTKNAEEWRRTGPVRGSPVRFIRSGLGPGDVNGSAFMSRLRRLRLSCIGVNLFLCSVRLHYSGLTRAIMEGFVPIGFQSLGTIPCEVILFNAWR